MMQRLTFSELPDVLTPNEAAQALPLSANTIRELCKRGEIHAVKTGELNNKASRWLFSKAALLEWLNGGDANA